MTSLSSSQLQRYSRQILLPELGTAGQLKLARARVLCLGAGGLGSPVLLYLAAAGVGTLGIVDSDAVELSNLHRQVIHDHAHLGQPKTVSAQARLLQLNPDVRTETHPVRLDADNALNLLQQYDVVIDGTDNFATRYLANDACVLLGKPYVYGAVLRFEGQASLFAPHLDGPCYRCLFPQPPAPGTVPNCSEGGVLGVLPGIIGCLQASETIKLLTGIGESLLGRMIVCDALTMQFRTLRLRRDPQCPICGTSPSIHRLANAEVRCEPPGLPPGSDWEVTVEDLAGALSQPKRAFCLLDVRQPEEIEIASLPGAISIPLPQLPERLGELNPNQPIVALCHHGVRSLHAAQLLRQHGFARAQSLAGGIDAWAQRIDQRMPRY